MRTKIVSNGLELRKDLEKQKAARERNLKSMDTICKNYFLSPHQMSLVETNTRIQYVEGIAGSGKTLICLERMKRLAEDRPNDKILYFCDGKPLAEFMKKLAEQENLENVTVQHTGLFPKITTFLLSLKRHISELKLGVYNHLLVDEYHNLPYELKDCFEEFSLKKLIENASLDGSFFVFYDNSQNLNGTYRVQVPEYCYQNQCVTKLDIVYRGTYRIAQFYLRFSLEWKTYQMGHEYLGQDVEMVYLEEGKRESSLSRLGALEREGFRKVREVVEQLNKEGYREEDILVITDYFEDEKKQLEKREQLKCKWVTCSESPGLESKIVIYIPAMIRKQFYGLNYSPYMIYLAASRAQWKCIVVVTHKEEAERLRNGGTPKHPAPLTIERSKDLTKKKSKK